MDTLSNSRTGALRGSIAALMAIAAVTLALASTIHFGVRLGAGQLAIHDPFPGAAIPEAVIAFVVACGALAVIGRRAAWPVALGTTLFAVAGVLFGLSITLGSARTGDVAYHVSVLVVLVVTLCLLVTPAARRALRRR
ncbi:MAG TPA: hypothetical protein VIA06_03070 [Candidatus Dormibacteraeota bacterium]|jgi:hypothetical protein|nr:hypothetical protein [Candidatus Dormibacteraeota bacterium]